VGAFSLKFLIAPSGETKDRIKKVTGVQKRDGPPLVYITMPSMVGVVGRAPAVDEKVMWCFFLFVLFCHGLELRSLL